VSVTSAAPAEVAKPAQTCAITIADRIGAII
jgi:hypothetical protein